MPRVCSLLSVTCSSKNFKVIYPLLLLEFRNFLLVFEFRFSVLLGFHFAEIITSFLRRTGKNLHRCMFV